MKFFSYDEQSLKLLKHHWNMWCNSCGDLWEPRSKKDIKPEDLPPVLKETYDNTWGECYDTLCYLAETSKGFTICLVYEYWNGDDERLHHNTCVSCAKKDAKLIESALADYGVETFICEWKPEQGVDIQAEVIVNIPLPITKKQMEGFSHACSILAYTNMKKWDKRRAELDAKQKRIKVKCADKAYMVTLSVTRAILVPATGINEDEARKKAVQAMYDGDYQAVSGPIVEVIDCDASRI